MGIREKYERLIAYLGSLESCVVAFSGGLDSILLLRAAKDALGDRVTAVTISTPYMPKREILETMEIAKGMGVSHKLLPLPLTDDMKFNPEDRCYLCKRHLFSVLKADARRGGIHFVLDGTNADDLQDYRPGIKALKELNIISPFLNQAWTKEDIRQAAKEKGLPHWDRRPGACLLSRMPYGHEITPRELGMIEKAERYLTDMGFQGVRVRSDVTTARIEVQREDRKLLFDESLLDDISRAMKGMGYTYVALELEGYQTGSMNRSLRVKND